MLSPTIWPTPLHAWPSYSSTVPLAVALYVTYAIIEPVGHGRFRYRSANVWPTRTVLPEGGSIDGPPHFELEYTLRPGTWFVVTLSPATPTSVVQWTGSSENRVVSL